MRHPRLFINQPLQAHSLLPLDKEAGHYLTTVLRLRPAAMLTVFNGKGGEFLAQLNGSGKQMSLQLLDFDNNECESALNLTLVQAISRPEHMDLTLQKATELGVTRIVPVITERSAPLDKERFEKRMQHWQKILQSACEQSGRNRLPELLPIQPLWQWLDTDNAANTAQILKLIPEPLANDALQMTAIQPAPTAVNLLIGAEGGFAAAEIQHAIQKGYQAVHLGKRILRTETAAISLLALCQGLWGDLTVR